MCRGRCRARCKNTVGLHVLCFKKRFLNLNFFLREIQSDCVFTTSPTPSPTRPLHVPYTSPTSPTNFPSVVNFRVLPPSKRNRNGRVDDVETRQLSCRMCYVFFNKPPLARSGRGLKHCPICWSRWVIRGEMQWRRQGNHAISEFMIKVAANCRGAATDMPGSDAHLGPH